MDLKNIRFEPDFREWSKKITEGEMETIYKPMWNDVEEWISWLWRHTVYVSIKFKNGKEEKFYYDVK